MHHLTAWLRFWQQHLLLPKYFEEIENNNLFEFLVTFIKVKYCCKNVCDCLTTYCHNRQGNKLITIKFILFLILYVLSEKCTKLNNQKVFQFLNRDENKN
jgi:hypothetical protein